MAPILRILRFLTLSLVLAAWLLSTHTPVVLADKGGDARTALGLVYAGLQLSDGACHGGFEIIVPNRPGMRPLCTHGPDPAPPKFDATRRVAPLRSQNRASASSVICDGDGVSGKRVQVLYAHAADVPDNYTIYADSFHQWVAGVDAIFNASAAETGGQRHVRFVTDANCQPIITDVMLSPIGDDTFGDTFNDLLAQGYSRTDRNYMVFVDAHVYCGISTMEYDDRPTPDNFSNLAPHYGRIDSGCWSDVIPAHELMHNLGGVQVSAPHSDGGSHCTDGFDDMCDHSGLPIQYPCADPAGDHRFDCNHDDYYSTSPAPNSYLATHWNAANSLFLIAPQSFRIDLVSTGTMTKNIFTATDIFARGSTITVRVHVSDSGKKKIKGADVSLNVQRPDRAIKCILKGKTDANGFVQASCKIPNNARLGIWNAHVDMTIKAGFELDTANSILDHNFRVK